MVKKVIQVPIDEELLKNLDSLSEKRGKARAEVIREACVTYLHQIENDNLDRIYIQGYKKIPEQPDVGEAQIKMMGEILSKESW